MNECTRDGTGSLFCNPDRPWSKTSSPVTVIDPATRHKIKPDPPKARSFYEPFILFNPNVKRKTYDFLHPTQYRYLPTHHIAYRHKYRTIYIPILFCKVVSLVFCRPKLFRLTENSSTITNSADLPIRAGDVT